MARQINYSLVLHTCLRRVNLFRMKQLKQASPRLERAPYVIGKVSALAFVTSCK